MTDVIGEEPTREKIKELDVALKQLENMTGMKAVKRSVMELVEIAKSNYNKELRGEEVDLITLNRLFIGNPGTGKTTTAEVLCVLFVLFCFLFFFS